MTNERERAASERIAADPFGVHEALHTAHVLMDSYALHVVEHPAVELRPDILALGEKAVEAMMDVYQALGALDCDETAYLMRSPRNAKRLLDSVREMNARRVPMVSAPVVGLAVAALITLAIMVLIAVAM